MTNRTNPTALFVATLLLLRAAASDGVTFAGVCSLDDYLPGNCFQQDDYGRAVLCEIESPSSLVLQQPVTPKATGCMSDVKELTVVCVTNTTSQFPENSPFDVMPELRERILRRCCMGSRFDKYDHPKPGVITEIVEGGVNCSGESQVQDSSTYDCTLVDYLPWNCRVVNGSGAVCGIESPSSLVLRKPLTPKATYCLSNITDLTVECSADTREPFPPDAPLRVFTELVNLTIRQCCPLNLTVGHLTGNGSAPNVDVRLEEVCGTKRRTDEATYDCALNDYLPWNCDLSGYSKNRVLCHIQSPASLILQKPYTPKVTHCLPKITDLTIVCTTNAREEFPPSSPIEVFTGLRFLSISRCCPVKLTRSYLAPINSYIYLSLIEIDGGGVCTGNGTTDGLRLEESAIGRYKYLKELKIVLQGVAAVPRGELCNAKSVTLSINELNDISSLHLGGDHLSTPERRCGRNMESLDLNGNNFRRLPAYAFGNLAKLGYLELQGNGLEAIDPKSFKNLRTLFRLDLSRNRIRRIPEVIFEDNEYVEFLAMSHNRLTELGGRSFCGLYRLTHLHLNGNQIASVHQHTFDCVNNLQLLNLEDNLIENVTARMWWKLTELTQLNLASNRLAGSVQDGLFNVSQQLTSLNLSGNRYESLESLPHLPQLQKLDLSNNRLSNISESVFLAATPRLRILNLMLNRLQWLSNRTFEGLDSLQHLHLQYNRLGQVDSATFLGCPRLKSLTLHHNRLKMMSSLEALTEVEEIHISHNQLEAIEDGCFRNLTRLRYLSLGDNLLKELPTLEKNLETFHFYGNRLTQLGDRLKDCNGLISLELQNNSLTTLDITLLPRYLVSLNVSGNSISSIVEPNIRIDYKNTGVRIKMRDYDQFESVDLSHNQLTSLPINLNNVTVYNLSNNNLSLARGEAFVGSRIRLVDLQRNPHMVIQKSSFLVASRLPQVNFKLEGIDLRCTCNLQWLKRFNDKSVNESVAYGTIIDLDRLLCSVPTVGSSTSGGRQPLNEVADDRFLCEFGVDMLPVRSVDPQSCPTECRCYVNSDWTLLVTYCSLANLSTVPADVSPDTVSLFLDGNRIETIASTDLASLHALTNLYLNGSRVKVVEEGALDALFLVTVLHLDNNDIASFPANTFGKLSQLQQLHLQHNRLTQLDLDLGQLPRLRLLHLNNNLLNTFPPVDINASTSISSLTLRQNPWQCLCSEKSREQLSLLDNLSSKIQDRNLTTCSNLNATGGGGRKPVTLFQFYSEYCNELAAAIPLVETLVPITVLLTVIVVAVLVFVFRYEMQVILYSRYQFRLFRNSQDETTAQDKMFDAFVAYCQLDEKFVAEELVPRLEGGDRPFRLCLHERNFLAGAMITNSILEAVDSSNRTIVVMSNNFAGSNWCRFEFKAAHVKMLEDRRHRLIMIMLDQVDTANLDPEVQLYIKTNTFLPRSDRLFWEKLVFAMPERPEAIKSPDQVVVAAPEAATTC